MVHQKARCRCGERPEWPEHLGPRSKAHLQDEDEAVGCLVPGVKVVACAVLVVFVKLELLNDVRVLEQPEQDLL